MSVRLAPSILSADFAALGDAVRTVERGGADQIHLDVMDGHFVPNLTIGPAVVKAVRRVTTLPLDVHLMVTDPDALSRRVRRGGRQRDDRARRRSCRTSIARSARSGSSAAGPAWPSTRPRPPEALAEVLDDLDIVLVMSVNPGFGGQSFIPHSESKIAARPSDA